MGGGDPNDPPPGQFVTVNSLVVRGLRDPKGGTSLGLRRGGHVF